LKKYSRATKKKKLLHIKSIMVAEEKRDEYNASRRAKYVTYDRQAAYQKHKARISEEGKADRANCPLCGLGFRRLYIKKHIVTRHKLSMEEALEILGDLKKTIE
jgi:hypothetical protein